MFDWLLYWVDRFCDDQDLIAFKAVILIVLMLACGYVEGSM